MISNPTLYRWGQRLLIGALILSLFFHFAGIVIWGIVSGRWQWLRPQPPEPMIVLSSSTTIQHRSVPVPSQPTNRSEPPVQPRPPTPPHLAVQPQQATEPAPNAPNVHAVAPAGRPELTYTAPLAPPKPQQHHVFKERIVPRRATPLTFAQRLAQEQQSFQREVAQLRARDNPLSVATIPPRPPSSYQRSYLNISGVDRRAESFEGLVTPVRTWMENGMRCHYAMYDVQYSSGAMDRGNIPWPLCYLPSRDPMTLPDGTPVPNGSPVPTILLYPMDGYVLPPGTFLTQFLRGLYERTL